MIKKNFFIYSFYLLLIKKIHLTVTKFTSQSFLFSVCDLFLYKEFFFTSTLFNKHKFDEVIKFLKVGKYLMQCCFFFNVSCVNA